MDQFSAINTLAWKTASDLEHVEGPERELLRMRLEMQAMRYFAQLTKACATAALDDTSNAVGMALLVKQCSSEIERVAQYTVDGWIHPYGVRVGPEDRTLMLREAVERLYEIVGMAHASLVATDCEVPDQMAVDALIKQIDAVVVTDPGAVPARVLASAVG